MAIDCKHPECTQSFECKNNYYRDGEWHRRAEVLLRVRISADMSKNAAKKRCIRNRVEVKQYFFSKGYVLVKPWLS